MGKSIKHEHLDVVGRVRIARKSREALNRINVTSLEDEPSYLKFVIISMGRGSMAALVKSIAIFSGEYAEAGGGGIVYVDLGLFKPADKAYYAVEFTVDQLRQLGDANVDLRICVYPGE